MPAGPYVIVQRNGSVDRSVTLYLSTLRAMSGGTDIKREWRADHRYVSTIAEPEPTVETGASIVIEAGRAGAQPA